MTIEEIKELLQIFNESGVGELELQRGKDRLKLRSAEACAAGVLFSPPAAGPSVVAAPAAVAHTPAPAPAPPPAAPASNDDLVKSPIVGTFYEAAAPDAPPFVKVGDSISVGQVLCIVEAMKCMNEIKSEMSGTITAKLVENGMPVEYGEALFSIRPR